MKLKDMIPFLEEHRKDVKVHCAIGRNKIYEPLNAFKLDRFKEWQEHQTKKNFQRPYILSLIYYGKDEWLFAGIYVSHKVSDHPNKKGFLYDTELTDIGYEYIGKAIFRFKKEFRQSYLCLERYLDQFELLELNRDPCKISFPGYDKVDVSWQDLNDLIETESWKTALENQKGVYLITDTHTGKRYVGKASGDEMLLGRWRNYIKNGHGNNAEFKSLDFDYIKKYFKYSILEIFKPTTSESVILERESWWKDVLLSRDKKFGYNDN